MVSEDVIRVPTCVWAGILAFHKARIDQPHNPLVVAAFSLALHGASLLEAVKIARSISQSHVTSFHELSECQTVDTNEALINEVMDLAESVGVAFGDMTNEYLVSGEMAKYPWAPCSDLVFCGHQSKCECFSYLSCFQMLRGRIFMEMNYMVALCRGFF